MAAFSSTAAGTIVLAGSGLTPARLLLVPAGTRLPPGVRPVAAVPARATGHAITARAHLSIGGGDATKEAALAILSVGDATDEGALAFLSLPVGNATRDYVTKGALAFLSVGNATTNEGPLASLAVDDITTGSGGVLSFLPVVDASNGGGAALSSLPVVGSTRAAAGFPARASAGPGLLFFGGDASARFGFGITSAALAGRASRRGGLVVAATAGSEAEGLDDSNSDEHTKGAFVVYDIISTQALDAQWVLDDIVPASGKAQFASKYADVKRGLQNVVMLAQGRSNPMGVAIELMRGWYGILELAYACYPNAAMPVLPGEQIFLGRCLTADDPLILGQAVGPLIAPLQVSNLVGRGVPDSDVDLIRSVFIAVSVCQATAKTARDGEPNI